MKLITIPYKPLPEISGFSLVKEPFGENQFLISRKPRYQIPLLSCRYIPKTGLALAQCLPQNSGDVLDIGTGDSAFLAIHASMLGAQNIVGCDIDQEAVRLARTAVTYPNITIVESDVFSGLGDACFNLIISNPPQMPTLETGNMHDGGGPDGRNVVMRILENGRRHLKPNGAVMMLLFDLLGVDEAFGKSYSIFTIAEKMGYTPTLLQRFQRIARKDGETANARDHIGSIYPEFRFEILPSMELIHTVCIVRFSI